MGYGGERARTDDLLRARQALSQLSYTPMIFLPLRKFGPLGSGKGSCLVGLDRFELSTSRLSGVRSDQLSYRPLNPKAFSSISIRGDPMNSVE